MREDNDLDRVIDSALATYAGADAGLERRTLARIGAAPAPAHRLRWMAWAAVLTAAACLLLFMVLTHGKPAHAPGESAFNLPPSQQAPKETARVAPQAAQPQSRLPHHGLPENAAGSSVAAALPKQQVFPTPRPLSPQERALAEFAAQAPEAEHKSFVAAQRKADEPIAIADIQVAPIQIPPLEPPSPGAN